MPLRLSGRENDSMISSIIDVPKVTPTTSLSDIISLVVKNPYPVAVVDDAGRLVGSVSRGAVLAALARKGGGYECNCLNCPWATESRCWWTG